MQFKGNGRVWNPEANKPLDTFVDGVYETEDEGIIEKLKSVGYEAEPEPKKKKK